MPIYLFQIWKIVNVRIVTLRAQGKPRNQEQQSKIYSKLTLHVSKMKIEVFVFGNFFNVVFDS